MTILENLYYGNINPSERCTISDGEYQKLNSQISDCIDELMKMLNDEEKQLFEKTVKKFSDIGCVAERESFIEGFRFGAQIMLEVTCFKSENFSYEL